jgi:hypothetical protein
MGTCTLVSVYALSPFPLSCRGIYLTSDGSSEASGEGAGLFPWQRMGDNVEGFH